MNEVINAIQNACIEIASCMRNSKIDNFSTCIDERNTSGDAVKRMDIIANDILKNALLMVKEVRMIGSEEEETFINTNNTSGKYLVCYDPLDGSSNIDSNITVGTIFAIYDLSSELRNGHNIICAGYCLYGYSTQFVVATDKVRSYQLIGDKFQKINDNLILKEKGEIYSVNESNRFLWTMGYSTNVMIYINSLIKQEYSLRWVGSMVTDCHRTLIKGGLFAYPVNSKNKDGKIRLLYEAYPFSYIFKIAGGGSSDGSKNILDIEFPENIHQKSGIFLGGKYEIEFYSSI